MGGLQSSTSTSQCTPAGATLHEGPVRATRGPPCPPGALPDKRLMKSRGLAQGGAGGLAGLPPLARHLHRSRVQGVSGRPQGARVPALPRPTCGRGPLTLSAPGTGTLVRVGEVDAGASILTRVGQAFVDLLRAVHPMVAGHALCGETKCGGGGLWFSGEPGHGPPLCVGCWAQQTALSPAGALGQRGARLLSS